MKHNMRELSLVLRVASILFILCSLSACAIDPIGLYMLAASVLLLVISLWLPRQ